MSKGTRILGRDAPPAVLTKLPAATKRRFRVFSIARVCFGKEVHREREALDPYGNLATSDNGLLSVNVSSDPSDATLSGPTAESIADGIAKFSGFSVDQTGIGFTLSAFGGDLPATTA
jgi:hypothetical protein